MKRPQSAKPGFKGYWGQASSDEIGEQSVMSKNQHRKQIKIMKPDLTTHDFARILPKKIHQDKERLYSQALQLKQTVNDLMEENMRLKTKISILEKEKDKMNRYIDSTSDNMSKTGNSRLNVYGMKSTEKENMMVRNLKKIIRQAKDENQYLKNENMKIKKTIKYTKINQIEIEKKIVLDQNKKLATLLEEYNSQIINQDDLERQNDELKKYLEEEVEQNKDIVDQNEKYQEIIQTLEDKLKTQVEKYTTKEKKLQRDLALEKRKTNEQHKYIEDLRRQIKNLQGNIEQANMKKKNPKPAARPMSSHPINYRSSTQQPKQNTLNVASKDVLDTDEIKKKNQILEKELQQIKLKLQQSQNELSRRHMKDNYTKEKVEISEPSPQKDTLEEKSIIKQKQEIANSKPESSRLEKKYDFGDSPNKEQESYNNNGFEEAQDYSQQFDKTEQIRPSNVAKKTKQDEQIEKIKKDLEENDEEEELYKKDQPVAKKKAKEEKDDKKKKKEKVSKGGYKPDKKQLAEIKELLTYRMKSQRYPFDDLKADIESAEADTFSYADLCNMLVNEPFYLTSHYTKVFLSYCYQKQNVNQNEMLTNVVLVTKLRKVVEDFTLMQQSQEKQMIMRIAEMTSTYPYELETAFENIKNGEDTVPKKDLITMFQKLELEDKYIELIIAELSLCSDDLDHLNFHGFFQRFYIEEEEGLGDPNAIDQEQVEQSEESKGNTSRIKKKGKTHKPSEELEQKLGGYMLAPEQPIESKDYAYDEDIVSDDGRI